MVKYIFSIIYVEILSNLRFISDFSLANNMAFDIFSWAKMNELIKNCSFALKCNKIFFLTL